MVVLIVCLVVVGVSLLALAILGYGLFGQLGRLQRTVAAAQNELLPVVESLRPPVSPGRHRAG